LCNSESLIVVYWKMTKKSRHNARRKKVRVVCCSTTLLCDDYAHHAFIMDIIANSLVGTESKRYNWRIAFPLFPPSHDHCAPRQTCTESRASDHIALFDLAGCHSFAQCNRNRGGASVSVRIQIVDNFLEWNF
jgi:hypothetical protein